MSDKNPQPAIEDAEAAEPVGISEAVEVVQPVAEPKIEVAHEIEQKSRIQAVRDQINAMPKVRIRISKEQGEQLVVINGARWNIPANIPVDVPEPVAAQLANAGRI